MSNPHAQVSCHFQLTTRVAKSGTNKSEHSVVCYIALYFVLAVLLSFAFIFVIHFISFARFYQVHAFIVTALAHSQATQVIKRK